MDGSRIEIGTIHQENIHQEASPRVEVGNTGGINITIGATSQERAHASEPLDAGNIVEKKEGRIQAKPMESVEGGEGKGVEKKVEKKDKKAVNEYQLTDVELIEVITRLKKAIPVGGKKEFTDGEIAFIAGDVILKRGKDAPIPQDAKVCTLVQIREAIKAPEKKENEPQGSYRLTDPELLFVVGYAVGDKTITDMKMVDHAYVTNVIKKIPDEVKRQDNERKTENASTLDDIRGAITTAVEKYIEAEKNKKLKLAPSKKYALLYAMWSARFDPDKISRANVDAALLDVERGWKRDGAEVDTECTYDQIIEEYRNFEPGKKEENREDKDVKTRGYFTDKEFQTVIQYLKNRQQKTAVNITMADFNGVKLPPNYIDKGEGLSRRQYTLEEIKQALFVSDVKNRAPDKKKEVKHDRIPDMNDAMLAFIVEALKNQQIDPDRLQISDIIGVVLANAEVLKGSAFSAERFPVALVEIKHDLRDAYARGDEESGNRPRTEIEMAEIGEKFTFVYSDGVYDIRRIADNPQEYIAFKNALALVGTGENIARDVVLKEIGNRIAQRTRERSLIQEREGMVSV